MLKNKHTILNHNAKIILISQQLDWIFSKYFLQRGKGISLVTRKACSKSICRRTAEIL